MFRLSLFSTLSLWILFYFSNILSSLWATSSLYSVFWSLFRLFFFFLPPFPPQPTFYHSQSSCSHSRSSSTTSNLRPLLPPSFSRAGLCHGGSSQHPSPACVWDKLWDLRPILYPEGPKALPQPPRFLPCTKSQTTLKQEASLQDPALSPAPLLPLWEVAGAEGIIWVHIPFSLTDLSQIEKHLGSFTSDPDNYLKEFKYLTQSYDLTWQNIYIILSSTLLLEEKKLVWQASQTHTDEIHRTDDTKPLGEMVVLQGDSNWGYQAGRPGWAACIPIIACLIAGLQKAGHKAVNFDKLQEITQRLDKNWAQFLARLTEALQKYTKLDPTSAEGTIVLNTHFISQSSPGIWNNLKKAEEGPQTPQQDLKFSLSDIQ